jgi:hypothetical protein
VRAASPAAAGQQNSLADMSFQRACSAFFGSRMRLCSAARLSPSGTYCRLRIPMGLLFLTHSSNIFYQNPELFESQRAVDELVDDIAYTLSVGRDTLNIVCT